MRRSIVKIPYLLVFLFMILCQIITRSKRECHSEGRVKSLSFLDLVYFIENSFLEITFQIFQYLFIIEKVGE